MLGRPFGATGCVSAGRLDTRSHRVGRVAGGSLAPRAERAHDRRRRRPAGRRATRARDAQRPAPLPARLAGHGVRARPGRVRCRGRRAVHRPCAGPATAGPEVLLQARRRLRDRCRLDAGRRPYPRNGEGNSSRRSPRRCLSIRYCLRPRRPLRLSTPRHGCYRREDHPLRIRLPRSPDRGDARRPEGGRGHGGRADVVRPVGRPPDRRRRVQWPHLRLYSDRKGQGCRRVGRACRPRHRRRKSRVRPERVHPHRHRLTSPISDHPDRRQREPTACSCCPRPSSREPGSHPATSSRRPKPVR